MLVIGLGGLLLLMTGAETLALLMLHDLRGGSVSLQRHFLSRNDDLEQIRSHIYLSGTVARDALLAPEPSGAQAQFSALRALRKQNEHALSGYSRSISASEARMFSELRRQIEAYWNVLEKTSSWTPAERERNRYRFFYEEVVPRRTAMLEITDQIDALNATSLKQGDDGLSELFARLQIWMVTTLVVTLVGGAALASFTGFHIMKLEGEVRRRLEHSVEARAALQELSAKSLRAQEDERRALSRELHDEVGQAFSTILMEIENLQDYIREPALQSRLRSIRGLAENGVNETRNMALLLRPSMLDDFGLLPALEWQGREAAKRTGLSVSISASALADQLPEEHKTCVYRVVQEALNNCARHAQATKVQVAVSGRPDEIVLTVQDDGCGFDAARVRGLGLLGMEERVRHLGGDFSVDSNPGRGTRLNIRLPLTSLIGSKNGHG
jgi:signal transduction histidine kinase